MSTNEKHIQRLNEQKNRLNWENTKLKAQLAQIEIQKWESHKQKYTWVKKFASLWAGNDLKNSTIDLYNELPSPSRATIGNFMGSLADRLTKLTIYGVIISLIPFTLLLSQVVLLYIQNGKIESQNKLIEHQNLNADTQNEKITKQIFQEEANNRHNIALLIDNILERIHDDLKGGNGTLSDPLIEQISALSQSLQPYNLFWRK